MAAALAVGGCSMSYQLESYFADKTPTGSVNAAGSIGKTAAGSVNSTGSIKMMNSSSASIPPPDLAFAKAAASEVLRRGEKDASLDWENPETGARGTVTPIASAYTQDGQTCRDFLASYVKADVQSWLQGEACQEPRGAWQVRALKPWQKS